MSQNKIMEPCQLCKTITSKYVCPKCNIQYCSIKCYRSPDHLACSEEFYRHCISEELGARGEDFNKSEINILEALKRFNEDENNEYEDIDSDEENEEVDDLEKRFAEIDVASTDKLWSLLNDEEKTEFQKLVASGKAIEMVPQWKPWWNFRSKSKVLESEEAFKDELKKNGCPEICTTKKLSEIIKKDPSPLVQFNVFNVLVGYCYIMLLFNGDLSDLSGEATMNLLKVSTNLNSSVNFNSAEEAIEDAIQQIYIHPELESSTEMIKSTREGVRKTLIGPHALLPDYYVMAAFSDIKAMFNRVLNQKSKSKESRPERDLNLSEKVENLDRKKVKLSLKKIEFFLAWACEFGNDFCRLFSNNVLLTETT